MILSILRKDPRREAAEALYTTVAEAARRPAFFVDWGVPDTAEGRFEVLALHMILLLDRLAADGPAAAKLAEMTSETYFEALDAGLRELGVGDLSVGRRIRTMAESYIGRAKTYRVALASRDIEHLEDALARNVYGALTAPAGGLASYMMMAAEALKSQPSARLVSGIVEFPATA